MKLRKNRVLLITTVLYLTTKIERTASSLKKYHLKTDSNSTYSQENQVSEPKEGKIGPILWELRDFASVFFPLSFFNDYGIYRVYNSMKEGIVIFFCFLKVLF